MNNVEKIIDNDVLREEKIRNILEWSQDGPGQHNFLRILADSISPEIEDLLRSHGYQVVKFVHAENQEDRAELERLIVNAQSFMNYTEGKKIAVVVSEAVYNEIRKDLNSKASWALNAQYMDTV